MRYNKTEKQIIKCSPVRQICFIIRKSHQSAYGHFQIHSKKFSYKLMWIVIFFPFEK